MSKITKARKEAYLKLLDDEGLEVRRGLLNAFRHHGESATEFLTEILDRHGSDFGRHARFFCTSLGQSTPFPSLGTSLIRFITSWRLDS